MYKIIACDLDETLLNTEHKISQKNIDAIQKAAKKGVRFVPATGRGFTTVRGDLDVSYSSNRYIEFNHKSVNKGSGLLKLAALLGVDPRETIAIGDNFNDLSMIKEDRGFF